jgi:hypothetical protein
MKTLRFGWIIAFLLFAGCSEADDPAAKQLALRAISGLQSQPNWDSCRSPKGHGSGLSIEPDYAGAPGTAPDPLSIRQDTFQIVRAVLAQLVAAGQHPASAHTMIWVWAERPAGKGETGQNLVEPYGHAEYQAERDQIEFEPWRP